MKTMFRTLRAPRTLVLALAALPWAVAPLPLTGQEEGGGAVRGRITQVGDGLPVQGALVVVETVQGEVAARRLTDAFGRFLVTGLPEDRYHVTADMIGYRAERSDLFDLALPIRAIPIRGFEVEGEKRCGLEPREGEALALVWEEVREALERNSLTNAAAAYVYEIENTQVVLDRRGNPVTEPEITPEVLVATSPFISMGEEILRDEGYAVADTLEDRVWYFGPDADVLLSRSFLETHCFELEEGEDDREGMIGLAFEPHDRGSLPEVEGVLWVDGRTLGLEVMEFRFKNITRGGDHERLGGTVVFMPLPDGTWIIREWALRIPELAISAERWMDGYRPRARSISYVKEGGARLVRVRDASGEPLLDMDAGLMRGIVLGADTGLPIPGVLVTLEGTGRLARTNAEGRFRFSGLEDGEYEVSFQSPDGAAWGAVTRWAEAGIQTFVRFSVVGR